MNRTLENVNVDVANIEIKESLVIKDITDEKPITVFLKDNSKIIQNDGKEELKNDRK